MREEQSLETRHRGTTTDDSRQEVRLLFTEKQLRKRLYLRRLHSNLIISVFFLSLSSRTSPLLASGQEILCILHFAQFRDIISFVSVRRFIRALEITDTNLNKDRFVRL